MAFYGSFQSALDSSGRVRIPARYRREIGETATLISSPDGCVELWSSDDFEQEEHALATEEEIDPASSDLRERGVLSRRDVRVDSRGRILIPDHMRAEAALTDIVIIAGRGECLEIWQPKRWEEEQNRWRRL